MHDLNYQLKQLCENNRDGSDGTQAQRAKTLQLCAEQLHAMGYRKMTTHLLTPKHVDGLTKRWLNDGLSAGTIKNRMSALRWWAAKVNRQNVIARSNEYYGIPDRKLVVEQSKAKSVSQTALEKVRDAHVRMSLELQQAFGLRREEAIKTSPAVADQGDRLVLKASWTEGGKAREIPIRTPEQRAVLDRSHALVGRGALIRPWAQLHQPAAGVRRPDHSRRPKQYAWPAACRRPAALPGVDRLVVSGGRRPDFENAES